MEALPRIAPAEDAEVSQVMARSFSGRGIKVMAGAAMDLKSVKVSGDGVKISVKGEDGLAEYRASKNALSIDALPGLAG